MKKAYYIYDSLTGKILQTGVCEDKFFEEFDIQGQIIAEGNARLSFDYVKDGQLFAIPKKPDGEFQFDYATNTWKKNMVAQWLYVRTERTRLLQESDWTQLPDVPLATKTAWAEYRQALRDITNQPDPFTIIWPTKPE